MLDFKIKDYRITKYHYIKKFHQGLPRVANVKDLYGYIDKKEIKKIELLPVYDARIIYGENAIQLEADTKEELRTKIVECLEALRKSFQQEIDNDVEKAKEYILKRE